MNTNSNRNVFVLQLQANTEEESGHDRDRRRQSAERTTDSRTARVRASRQDGEQCDDLDGGGHRSVRWRRRDHKKRGSHKEQEGGAARTRNPGRL